MLHGHIYTPHGPSSPNEVLLELPASRMVRWKWSDMHSIVFLIERARLARGDFDEIMVDITN